MDQYIEYALIDETFRHHFPFIKTVSDYQGKWEPLVFSMFNSAMNMPCRTGVMNRALLNNLNVLLGSAFRYEMFPIIRCVN